MSTKITAIEQWNSYNKRRYGWPWVARITAFDGAPTLEFLTGCYNGDDNGGEIIIKGEVGEIIKMGQKDHRGNGTVNTFAKIRADGTLEWINDHAEARREWIAWQDERARRGEN